MNTLRFTLAAALLASAAATAATSPASTQEESSAAASTTLRLLEEQRTPDGKEVPVFDLPLVVRDEYGNVVLDARTEGPLPLARLARANAETEEDRQITP